MRFCLRHAMMKPKECMGHASDFTIVLILSRQTFSTPLGKSLSQNRGAFPLPKPGVLMKSMLPSHQPM